MAETAARLVLTSFPDESTAQRIANQIVEHRLAACVSLLPAAQSVYVWEGKVQHDSEWLGLIKTTEDRYAELEKRLLEWHPYDTPECIGVEITAGSPDYLRWLQIQCADRTQIS